MKWDGVEWNEMEWNEKDWNRIECSGMDWKEIK